MFAEQTNLSFPCSLCIEAWRCVFPFRIALNRAEGYEKTRVSLPLSQLFRLAAKKFDFEFPLDVRALPPRKAILTFASLRGDVCFERTGGQSGRIRPFHYLPRGFGVSPVVCSGHCMGGECDHSSLVSFYVSWSTNGWLQLAVAAYSWLLVSLRPKECLGL